MTNLRHPGLSKKDIQKLINYKSQTITWGRGIDETNEWIFASTESKKHKKKLLYWLNNKKIIPSRAVLLITPNSQVPIKLSWGDVINEPEKYFNKKAFQLYDLDLAWVLEYQTQEIARFGCFDKDI